MFAQNAELSILDYRISRELDEFTQNDWGFSGTHLMGLASMGIKNRYQDTINRKENIHILCGKGNNGGDGYALAFHLIVEKTLSIVWEYSEPKTESAIFFRNAYLKSGGIIKNLHDFKDNTLNNSIIFECLLGTGSSPGLNDEFIILEECLMNYRTNCTNLSIIAIDHPTFQLDIYDELAEIGCFKSENTEIPLSKKNLISIGFPIEYFLESKNTKRNYYYQKSNNWESLTKEILQKKDNFHKYNSGSAIFIGGEKGMEGALYLSIQAFLGCGGGIAKSFFLSPDAKSLFLESNPSLMIDHWNEDSKSDPFWNKTKTVVMGPGTDASKNYKPILDFLVSWANENPSRRIILDAGAILPTVEFSDQWILTPHLGEYARLAPKQQEIHSNNILENGKLSAQVLNCNLLIKSSKQYFNDPQGNSWIWDYPNSKLATMGTGDLLTGIIALALNRNSKPKKAIYNSLCFLDLSRNMDLTSPTASEILEYLKVQ